MWVVSEPLENDRFPDIDAPPVEYCTLHRMVLSQPTIGRVGEWVSMPTHPIGRNLHSMWMEARAPASPVEMCMHNSGGGGGGGGCGGCGGELIVLCFACIASSTCGGGGCGGVESYRKWMLHQRVAPPALTRAWWHRRG
ncbi:unnamed protein product [Taenia asiatica]|uniref:Uncharacterized protein n=1 Tax=Taenia asiatica TaxID=60517 RepID=A0A0R3VXZ9_TAEAS|nr:unnamed protein product [Taenia asiatica]